jgi:hypothetical protein
MAFYHGIWYSGTFAQHFGAAAEPRLGWDV